MSKRQILPGDLIRPKLNMRPALWVDFYVTSDSIVISDTKSRVRMENRALCDLNEPAFVVAVFTDHDVPHDIDVLLLYVPSRQHLYYTWSSYVMSLSNDKEKKNGRAKKTADHTRRD